MPLVDQPDPTPDDILDFDLSCPSCGADLLLDDTFLTARVCGACRRHFSMSARERIGLLADPDTFEEFVAPEPAGPESVAPERVPSAERLAEIHERQVMTEAVVTGSARVRGVESILIMLDDHLVGATPGVTLVEKIIEALGQAISRRLPIVLVCTGGARTPNPGPLSVVQPGRLASAFAQVHVSGLPVVAVLAHPVAVSIHAMLATHSDIVFAEPGVRITSTEIHPDSADEGLPASPRQLLADGWIDAVVDRTQVRGTIAHVLDLLVNPGSIRTVSRQTFISSPPSTSSESDAFVLNQPDRPDAYAMQMSLLSDQVVLRGDRVSGDVAGVSVGFARLESLSVAFVTVTDGAGVDYAAAARKISRLARFASRQERPIVIFIDEKADAPVRAPSMADHQAIASLASLLAVLPVPLVTVGLSLVASPLALAIFPADRQFLLSQARLLSGGATGSSGPTIHRRPGRLVNEEVSLSARECELLGLIDDIIEEPPAGSHLDSAGVMSAVRAAIVGGLAELVGIGPRRLLDTRYRRQRDLGLSTPEGLAAVRSELWEIQEWQRSVGRSIDDLRLRWDQFRSGNAREAGRHIDVPDLVSRWRARRDELLNRAGRSDRSLSDTESRDDAAGN